MKRNMSVRLFNLATPRTVYSTVHFLQGSLLSRSKRVLFVAIMYSSESGLLLLVFHVSTSLKPVRSSLCGFASV